MINIIKARDQIKRMNDGEVRRVATGQSPLGGMGALLATAEIKDRNDQRQEYEAGMAGQRPQTTVVEDVLKGGGAPSPRPTPSLSPLGAGGLGAPPPLGGATQRQMSRPAVPQQMAQAAPRPMPQAMPQPRPAAMPAQMPMPMPQRAQEGGIVYAQTGWPVDTRGGLGSILNFFAEKRRRKHPSQMTAEELRAQEAELALAGEVPRELEIPNPPVLSQLQSKLTGAPSELQLQWGQRQTPVADPALPPVETVTTTAPSPDTHRQAMLDVLSGKSGSLSQFSSDAAHQEALLNAMSGGQHMQPTDISGPSFAEAWLPQGTGGGYYFDKLKKALVGLTPAGQQRMLETHALSQQPTAIASLSDEQRRISQIPGRVISPVGAVSRHAVGADEFAVNPFAAGDPDMGAVNANMTTLASATPSSSAEQKAVKNAEEMIAQTKPSRDSIVETVVETVETLTPPSAQQNGDRLLEGEPSLDDSSQRLQAMLEKSQAESKDPAKAPLSLVEQYKALLKAQVDPKVAYQRTTDKISALAEAFLTEGNLPEAFGKGLTGVRAVGKEQRAEEVQKRKVMTDLMLAQGQLDIAAREAAVKERGATVQESLGASKVKQIDAMIEKYGKDDANAKAKLAIERGIAATDKLYKSAMGKKLAGTAGYAEWMMNELRNSPDAKDLFDDEGNPYVETIDIVTKKAARASATTARPLPPASDPATVQKVQDNIRKDLMTLANQSDGWHKVKIENGEAVFDKAGGVVSKDEAIKSVREMQKILVKKEVARLRAIGGNREPTSFAAAAQGKKLPTTPLSEILIK